MFRPYYCRFRKRRELKAVLSTTEDPEVASFLPEQKEIVNYTVTDVQNECRLIDSLVFPSYLISILLRIIRTRKDSE